jgi:drug/metabolite transporter (DMT)-like permease
MPTQLPNSRLPRPNRAKAIEKDEAVAWLTIVALLAGFCGLVLAVFLQFNKIDNVTVAGVLALASGVMGLILQFGCAGNRD